MTEPPDHGQQVRALERRLARERTARAEAEAIAERATRQLYDTLQQLRTSTRVAELLGDVAVHANEATSLGDAMTRALESVCAFTGWPLGHVYSRSEADPSTLESLRCWYAADETAFQAFRTATEETPLTLGRGLPGRIARDGEPIWIVDLQADDNFPRGAVALKCGLRSGFALPVLVRSETAAVLEFFTTEPTPKDEELLGVLRLVGAQLGRVIERQAAEARLTRLALYDGLTGLPNRMLLMDRLQTSLARARRSSGRVDVLYLDVDDFKTINDSRGHAAGDALLTALAARLQEELRSSDVVARPTPATLARLGGDEFAVVLEDCAEPQVVATRIEERLTRPLDVSDSQVFVTVSIGTASALPGGSPPTAEELLAAANLAMHQAKRSGKATHVAFQPWMHEEARRRHELGDELHRAVENGEFELAYQPVVTLPDGCVIGAEALIRWRHPAWGMVPPGDFIERAEETGLIVPMGRWVLETACRQAASWQAAHPALSIAVNVSGRQLREPDFVDVVHRALADSGLSAESLCLEMTESILMEREDDAIAMLNQLRADGVHLAIDDFGTGYSSLSALRRLPVDLLKIDRSFVASLPADEDAGTIAWAVVRLGHTLGLPVLAEGVETEAQRDVLATWGCDQAQGWLFGRPLSPAEFADVLGALPSAGG